MDILLIIAISLLGAVNIIWVIMYKRLIRINEELYQNCLIHANDKRALMGLLKQISNKDQVSESLTSK